MKLLLKYSGIAVNEPIVFGSTLNKMIVTRRTMTVVLHYYILYCRSSLLCTESLTLCSTVPSE